MSLVKMAWRNLWRRKRRTLITASSVAFGVFLSVTFTASGDYGYTNMIDASAKMGFGHVTVEPEGFNMTPSLQKKISDANVIREKVLKVSGVTSAMTRISGQAMFSSAVKSVGGLFIGIDPAQELVDYNVFINSIVEGELFKTRKGRGAVVGSKVAEKLKIGIGKKLVYTATDVNGEIVSAMARVTGIFKTGVAGVDGSMILLPIDTVRKTLKYGASDATMVAVMIADQRNVKKIRRDIESAINADGTETLTWSETQADISAVVAIDRSMNYLFQVLIGLMISAGILNTIMMAVLERQREFGIMLAIGMSPSRLFNLVLAESAWLGFLGLTLGVLITTPWFIYMSETGIDLSSLMEEGADLGGVLVDPVMKFRLYKESAMAILSGVFILTILSGLYPAWRAGKTPPVESIKTI